MTALAEFARTAQARRRAPHLRMRLLIGARPDVDAAVLEIFALPRERPVVRRHRLENEVVRLPEPVHHPHWARVRRHDLVRHALDEAHLQPAARDHVDDRHLLGDPQRVVAVGDRRAEAEQPRAFGLPRQDREREVHRRAHAGRGRVVLVDDDVEAEFVGQHPLVEIAVIEARRDLRIAMPVGQVHAQRFRVCEPGVGIGLLGEGVDFHRTYSAVSREPKSPRAVGRPADEIDDALREELGAFEMRIVAPPRRSARTPSLE